MKYREIVKLIESDGWYLHSTVGSHQQYKHPSKRGALRLPESLAKMFRKEL
jgi:predicted RNA binding protein YcfA (HicA-like mRNA interferase family)